MKILYVTTISNTVNAFLIPHIKMLIDEGHQVDVAFNLVQEVKKDLLELKVNIYQVPFNRSPLSINNVHAYKDLKKLVQNEKYDIVHTHTPVASAIVRLACKSIKETKVFYTAHGFHFHKGAPLLNWMIYYPLERYLSRYTDTLITINKEDYNRAKHSFNSKNIEYIPGVGIDLETISSIKIDWMNKRRDLNIPRDAFVLLSVGELNNNKNHEVIIKALAEINNPNIHYLICGEGPLKYFLVKLIKKLKIENNIHLFGFRKDVLEFYKISNLFIFPSKREGLPVSIMEAMSIGLPLIVSNCRGNIDLVEDNINGITCDNSDVNSFKESILKLYESENLRLKFTTNGIDKSELYSQRVILIRLKELYY